jgi:hypothetical protein
VGNAVVRMTYVPEIGYGCACCSVAKVKGHTAMMVSRMLCGNNRAGRPVCWCIYARGVPPKITVKMRPVAIESIMTTRPATAAQPLAPARTASAKV